MSLEPAAPSERLSALRTRCAGAVHLAGEPGYDQARTPWNLSADLHPAAVALPRDAADVSGVLRAAADAGLRVAPQGTGHNAGPLGPLESTVLLRTSAMTGVAVDPQARVARVAAGTLWSDLVEAAAAHGLACLHGSSPDVGVVGYCLGGGLGWYARKLGLASNSVLGAEVVLADGSCVRADHEQNPELFWALRGGGGSFGVVTSLELRLYPIETAYAGMLVWDQEHAERVLRAWVDWSRTAPDEVTTAFRMLNLPPLPELPEPFRGRRLAVVDGAVLGDDAQAEAILADLRALGPEVDTFARVPAASLAHLHMDPEEPTPGRSRTTTLRELPEAAVETFLALTGPASASSLLSAELRQLGGSVGRPLRDGGVVSGLEGEFLLMALGIAATPEMGAQVHADATALVDALAPYATQGAYLNFTEEPVDVGRSFTPEAWQQLRGVRSMVDPNELLQANHPVPRLSENGLPTA